MVANEEILRLAQAGLETTRGTAVAATRKLYATVSPTYERALREFTDTSGTFSPRRRPAYARPRIAFSITDLLTFEDLAWWMQLGLKGGVTGVSDAGTPPAYTYGFTPSLAVDDLKSATLEFNHVGNAYKASQVMMNSFTVRIDPDNEGGWMLDAELMGRDWTSASYTGSITDRTTEVIKAPGTKVYLDDSTMGSTQLTGALISASITCNTNIHMKAFAEDELSYAANKVGRGPRTFDGQVVLEFDSDTEFAKYRSDTPVKRLLRLEREGSQIHGSPNTNKRARIDLIGYWSSWAPGNREGNIIATFGVQGYLDAVAGYDGRIEVVNALATLP